MSIVTGFPQSYHHHHQAAVHHHHHHLGHHVTTGHHSPADPVYAATATAYYPTSIRYDGNSSDMTGNSADTYYAAWTNTNYVTGSGSSSDMTSANIYGTDATDYPPPSSTAVTSNNNHLMQHPMDTVVVTGGGSGYENLRPTTISTIRVVKRRGTANRKERRRTLSINTAFADLRDCIPNVPSDTKLSKIKTLRLATSYIAYLMDILAKDDPSLVPEGGFKAEVSKKIETREEKKKREMANLLASSGLTNNNVINHNSLSHNEKKSKGRTGWPQHVWALELKQ